MREKLRKLQIESRSRIRSGEEEAKKYVDRDLGTNEAERRLKGTNSFVARGSGQPWGKVISLSFSFAPHISRLGGGQV